MLLSSKRKHSCTKLKVFLFYISLETKVIKHHPPPIKNIFSTSKISLTKEILQIKSVATLWRNSFFKRQTIALTRSLLFQLSDVSYQQDIFPTCHKPVPYYYLFLENIVWISIAMIIYMHFYSYITCYVYCETGNLPYIGSWWLAYQHWYAYYHFVLNKTTYSTHVK